MIEVIHVAAREARSSFSFYVKEAFRGKIVRITSNGTPTAALIGWQELETLQRDALGYQSAGTGALRSPARAGEAAAISSTAPTSEGARAGEPGTFRHGASKR